MKSCLKTPSLPGSPNLGACYKHVAWGAEGSEEVHWADEWDRTPAEPAQKLSYQELLELEEITQSLPNVRQPYDLRPPKQALSRVPIGLLPLVSADPPKPVSPTSPLSPQAPTPTFVMPPGRARPSPVSRLASPSLTHLRPLTQPAPRPRPVFSFVPLLAPESPAPAPTESSPSYFPPYTPERAAADGEPDRIILPRSSKAVPIPSSHKAHAPAFGACYEAQYRAAEAAAYSPPFGSSAYDYKRDKHRMLGDERQSEPRASGGKPAPKRRKKKKMSIMVINDMEIEIEEEESETDSAADDSDADDSELAKGVARMTLPEAPSIPKKAPSPSPPPINISPSPPNISTDKLSPRLATRPLSPRLQRPQSPTTMTTGRLSPVQARASSRLVRV